jgi:hypothetical protein
MPQTLTIRAGTQEVADGLFVVLHGFQPAVNPSPLGGYDVTVAIEGNPGQLVAILAALETHLTQRHDGPAQVELNGHKYSLEPEPAAE